MYLNQKASWMQQTDLAETNIYGDIEYGTSVIISVRRQEHVEDIRLEDGTIVKSKYYYYTYEDVKINDKLDGLLVIQLYDMNTLSGRKKLRRLITI